MRHTEESLEIIAHLQVLSSFLSSDNLIPAYFSMPEPRSAMLSDILHKLLTKIRLTLTRMQVMIILTSYGVCKRE